MDCTVIPILFTHVRIFWTQLTQGHSCNRRFDNFFWIVKNKFLLQNDWSHSEVFVCLFNWTPSNKKDYSHWNFIILLVYTLGYCGKLIPSSKWLISKWSVCLFIHRVLHIWRPLFRWFFADPKLIEISKNLFWIQNTNGHGGPFFRAKPLKFSKST